MNSQGFLNIGVILFSVGIIFSILGGIIFKFKAIANKKAWSGITIPCFVIALVTIIPGFIIIIINIPH